MKLFTIHLYIVTLGSFGIAGLEKFAKEIMYEYNAIVDRVVDGDTIRCTIDLGFSTWKKDYSTNGRN